MTTAEPSTLNGAAPRRKISDEHVEILRARGIPIELAEAAGLESADGLVASKLLGYPKPCTSGGLGIPYRKTCPPYWRIRMDRGDVRYLCPKGRPVPIYVPPAYEVQRPDDLANVLLVVEAPLKALAMMAAGLSAVGLGGVATTLDRTGTLNDSWAALGVRGRDVRVLFDANRATNEDVAAAEKRLVKALERAGAEVRVCSLPLTDLGGDQGPDDYLAQHGAEALYDVVRGAQYASPRPSSPLQVLSRWREEGPTLHQPTGLAQLDALTGGGPLYGSRWYLAGAPDAGKTALIVHLAHVWAAEGIFVGILAVDEEDGDLTTRIAQRTTPLDPRRARFTRRDCEDRPGPTLNEVQASLASIDPYIRFFGEGWTIEAAAEALADHARSIANGGPVRLALFVDSIQTATCEAALSAKDPSPRELVTANVRALRAVGTRYRLIAIATSEMNRGAYRSLDAAEQSNDLAAAKESGAIEYSARVLLALRSVKEQGDLIQVRVPKNKHGVSYPRDGGELYLHIDRDRQTIESGEAPAHVDQDQTRDDQVTRKAQSDAMVLLPIIVANPRIGSRKLREKSSLGTVAIGRALEWLESEGRIKNTPSVHGTRIDPHYSAVSASNATEAVQ